MSVTIKPTPRLNPLAKNDPPKYYPHVVSREELDLNKLADLISDGSTVRRNDVYAVLVGLVDVSIKSLKDGKKLRFGELGLFYLSVRGTAVDNPDEFHAGQVQSAKVCYLASMEIKESLRSIHYTTQKK